MDSLLQDLRGAGRAIGRMRVTAAVAILTLAFGIAATTTMVSVVHATLFRPVPFPDPDSLVILSVVRQTPRTGTARLRWSYPKIAALRQGARSYDALAAFTSNSTVSVAEPAGAVQMTSEIVSAAYFPALGARAVAGRTFLDAEDAPGHPVAIVGEGLWRRRFGGAPFSDDRTIVVNGETLTIVGVLPETFRGIGGRSELWFPIGLAPLLTYREFLTTPQHFINVLGRLKPGVSLAEANAELGVLGPTLPAGEQGDEPATWSAEARPLDGARIDTVQARSAWLLLAAVACVLLVTCINVATLLLIRARLRRREIAVRLAIGASRFRIVRQLLTESAVLAVGGGVLGLLLTAWGIALVGWASPDAAGPAHTGYVQISAFSSPRLDGTAFLWAAVLTIGCTLATGLAPALQTSRGASSLGLTDAGRTTAGGFGRSLRALAGIEVALAVLLLAGAMLFVTTFAHLQRSDTGFDSSQVLTFWITPPSPRYPPESGPAILERVLARVEQVPGVRSAALNRCTPFGSSCARTTLYRPEQPVTSPSGAPVVGRHYVSPDYLRTLGMPLKAGRFLTADDRMGRPPVAVVNEAAARRFWPGEDPIGKHVWFGSATGFTDPRRPVEIVGVVGDVKYWPLNEPAGPDFYTSYLQFAYPDSVFMVRAAGEPRALVAAIRGAVAGVDDTVPVWDVRLLDEAMSGALSRPRFNAALTAGFALTAVLLAGLGIFGVIASGIAARTRELAIRVALGSTPAGLRRLVFAQTLRIAVAGSAAGLAGAAVLLRLVGGMLYGVRPADPFALGAAVVTMIAIALAAAIVPAARAARTDPIAVLKQE